MTVVETFWADHQVGGPYDTLDESEQALEERQAMFPDLPDLMPVHYPDATVLDFGCGPGHDTILFLQHGARHVYYADVSAQALTTTARRLCLHGYPSAVATPWLVRDHGTPNLPRVDHAHCAGVLHHVSDPASVLQALRRSLNDGAELRLMVYSGDESQHSQSKVPVTRWWASDKVGEVAAQAGLTCEYVGSYPCSAPWRPGTYAACYRCQPA